MLEEDRGGSENLKAEDGSGFPFKVPVETIKALLFVSSGSCATNF